MISHEINGRVLNVIINLYKKAKSCVKSHCGQLSHFFPSLIGVRQGDNLSPLLFAIYLNDLESELLKSCKGLNLILNLSYELQQTEDTVTYCRLISLLAESEKDLQTALDKLNIYCHGKDFFINVTKTKIMVFSRGKIRNKPSFHLGNSLVEVVNDYTYLGICFNYNGKLIKAEKKLYDQASKAMYSLIAKGRRLALLIDIQLKLFYQM